MTANRDTDDGAVLVADRADRIWSAAWRGAWIGVPVIAALCLLAVAPVAPATLEVLLALLLLTLPAALSFVRSSSPYDIVGTAVWTAICAASAVLTGGLTGPFAALCMAPLAAAVAPPAASARQIAQGAVGALAAVIVVVFLQVAGIAGPTPAAAVSAWLGFVSVAGVALTLAAGLIRNQRTLGSEQRQHAHRAAYLQALLEGQPDLIVALSMDGRVRAVFGVPPQGVPEAALRSGLEYMAQASDRPAVRAALRAAALNGQGGAVFAPAGAVDRTVALSLRRRDQATIVGVVRDATAERAREAVLEEGKAAAESRAAGRARFLANMSHELRTPLNAIMGFSDIIQQRLFGPISDRYGEYAQLIHESGGHLLDLINDLLDMSKIEAERFELSREDFDGREAITAALRLMRVQADSAGVKLRGVLPPRPLEIDADRRALKQIVLNLVSNALKFTPKGGSVTVAAHGVGSMFELIVADTGSGIAPEDLARLGKPYEQAGDARGRALGTGLGLSLVQGLSQLHGGEMILESRLGAGTSVTVRLPVMAKPVEQPPMPAADQSPELGGNVVAFTSPRATNGD